MKKSEENQQNSLFSGGAETTKVAPLAERMRPTSLDGFIGQEHILGKGKLLNRLISSGSLSSSIFYGPPGTGKTTLSYIIANTFNANMVKLNAVSSGVSEAKAVIDKAKQDLEMFGIRTFLLLDECHRWSKAQSDCVLSAIEQGIITFIGSTTENPFYSMTKAIVSRCRIFEFKPLELNDIKKAVLNAVNSHKGLGNYKVELTEGTLDAFAYHSGGDVRSALGSLELAFSSTDADDTGKVVITPEIASECSGGRKLSLDETEYYDMLSAFCKSLRGTDPDGALYWAFRLIEGGISPEVIARRLIAHSSEDVGLANNNALLVATSALTAYKELGSPEGLIPLTQAIINTAISPKSNAVIMAMESVQEAVKDSRQDKVPNHLKNYNFLNEKREKYKYPHEYGGYVTQQYLPDEIKDRVFYKPTENGNERKLKEILEGLKGGNDNVGEKSDKGGN